MIKKILLGLLVLIVILAAGGYAYYRFVIYQPPLISEKDRAAITLMPLPAKLKLNHGFLSLSHGLDVRYTDLKSELIEKSVNRFMMRTNKKAGQNLLKTGGAVLEISCILDARDDIQQLREDESYTLVVNKKLIALEAPSQYGIIRGLETLFQLIQENDAGLRIPLAEISDNPRFPWRGIMLDVCRHWMPKDVVLRTLDAMAVVKMNVFHWHLSEDQGFRVESKIFPKLHEIGSNGKYYTQNEIKEVIQYAAERGIRVVPEFDLPGHSKSWQIAYPELSSVDIPLAFGTKNGIAFTPPLDPTKEEVYAFLDQFIGEMAALFPDPYFHIGGDEVSAKYWNESATIQKFMEENNMHDHHDLQAYFNKRLNEILKKHGKLMLGWDEILHPDLGEDIVVQSWRSHKSLFEAVQNGGTAILSSGLYLDLILSAEKHYKVDPLILEGAIDLEPDTANWKMYDLTMDIAGNEMKSQLVIFDKDSGNVSGFFSMMESRMAFKNGSFADNELNFSFLGPAGEMNYSAEFLGDSISGKISLGLLSFDSWGSLSGGSDIPGTVMPKIEVMKPLTEEEESRIIGGEACQWAEFVDAENVESRLWPRSAAIAEKLWSPQELTSDVDDMYRRLAVVSGQLTNQGSTHESQYEIKLKKLIAPEGFEYLKNLMDALEEVKFHGRMTGIMNAEYMYLPDFPMDRIVDAAKPESMKARAFNKLVDAYMDDQTQEQLKSDIEKQLEKWAKNHEQLSAFIAESEKLKDVEKFSLELSVVSVAALNKLGMRETNFSEDELMEKLSFLETGEHGVIVAVASGIRRILTEL